MARRGGAEALGELIVQGGVIWGVVLVGIWLWGVLKVLAMIALILGLVAIAALAVWKLHLHVVARGGWGLLYERVTAFMRRHV